VCHFVDFLTFLAGSLPGKVYAKSLPNNGQYSNDNLTVTIEFTNGSLGTITYVANGDKSFSKEHVEVFGGGAATVLEHFRKLEMTQNGRRRVVRSWLRQDKGHIGEWEAFIRNISLGCQPSIEIEEIVRVTLCTLSIAKLLENGSPLMSPSADPNLNRFPVPEAME